jgi:hypothetical protein
MRSMSSAPRRRPALAIAAPFSRVLLKFLRIESKIGSGGTLPFCSSSRRSCLSRAILPSPRNGPAGRAAASPLAESDRFQQEGPRSSDRVTIAGFRDPVSNARPGRLGGGDDRAGQRLARRRDAWQAAWPVWPHKSEDRHDADPFDRRGVYVVLGDGPKKRELTVLFKNQAGAVWSIEEGEPR